MVLPVDFYQRWIMGKQGICFPEEQPENVIAVFSYFGELCSPVYVDGKLAYYEEMVEVTNPYKIGIKQTRYMVLMRFENGRMDYVSVGTFSCFAKFHEYIPREQFILKMEEKAMTNILKHGYFPEMDKRPRIFTCPKCGCQFETDEIIVEKEYVPLDTPLLTIYTKCPECHNPVEKKESIVSNTNATR